MRPVAPICVNTVGPGLWPQSKPNHKRLGISEEQAVEIAEQAEWEFERFNIEADALGVADFYGIQFQPDIRDGIRMGGLGDPRSYFLADVVNGRFGVTCGGGHYTELPRKAWHRPVVMHHFFQKYPEQNRGVFGMVLSTLSGITEL